MAYDFQQLFNPSYSLYKVEMINDEVFAYGKNMINRTEIKFDKTQQDVTPPVLTMLRVINQEKISMLVTDANAARLEITAGDYLQNTYFDGRSWVVKYDKKPNIEIYWSTDGETFHELPAVEDQSKFHVSYGNFFEVSLVPLTQADVYDKWITIKVVLTDDAGNRNEQVLEPLFKYGESLVNVDDYIPKKYNSSMAYPNPFTGMVNIEVNNPLSGVTWFEVYDLSDRIIHQEKIEDSTTTTFTWNGTYVNPGVYFYGIYNQGNVIAGGKIIKK